MTLAGGEWDRRWTAPNCQQGREGVAKDSPCPLLAALKEGAHGTKIGQTQRVAGPLCPCPDANRPRKLGACTGKRRVETGAVLIGLDPKALPLRPSRPNQLQTTNEGGDGHTARHGCGQGGGCRDLCTGVGGHWSVRAGVGDRGGGQDGGSLGVGPAPCPGHRSVQGNRCVGSGRQGPEGRGDHRQE